MKELYTYCALGYDRNSAISSVFGWGTAVSTAEAVGLASQQFKDRYGCQPQSVDAAPIDIELLCKTLASMGIPFND
jgi:hypothetical protein